MRLLISQSAFVEAGHRARKADRRATLRRRPHSFVLTKALALLGRRDKSFDRLDYARDDIRITMRTRSDLAGAIPPIFAVHLAVPSSREFKARGRGVETRLVSPYGVEPPPGDVDVRWCIPTDLTDLVTTAVSVGSPCSVSRVAGAAPG